MPDLSQLKAAIIAGDQRTAGHETRAALDDGVDPQGLLDAMTEALDVVGDRFQCGEMFVPKVLISARAMKEAMAVLEPARAAAGPDQVLLGNLNPVTELMTSTPATIATQLAERHRQAGPRWIVGAGCEIPAATPPENVEALVAYARGTRP